MSETIEHRLKEPITVETLDNGRERRETIEVIKLRTRMIARDLRVLDAHQGEIGKTIAMIAQLSGLPIGTIDLIGAADFAALMAITEGFTLPGPTNGVAA